MSLEGHWTCIIFLHGFQRFRCKTQSTVDASGVCFTGAPREWLMAPRGRAWGGQIFSRSTTAVHGRGRLAEWAGWEKEGHIDLLSLMWLWRGETTRWCLRLIDWAYKISRRDSIIVRLANRKKEDRNATYTSGKRCPSVVHSLDLNYLSRS